MADVVAGKFVVVVVLNAVAMFWFWGAVRPEPSFGLFGLINAVAVLIIACPCGTIGYAHVGDGGWSGSNTGVLFREMRGHRENVLVTID